MKLTLHVVDRYLKPDGVFYEVLSEDRDGVGAFVESIQRLGFIVDVMDSPEKVYCNFNTRSWSKQVRTFTRLSSSRQTPSTYRMPSDIGYLPFEDPAADTPRFSQLNNACIQPITIAFHISTQTAELDMDPLRRQNLVGLIFALR